MSNDDSQPADTPAGGDPKLNRRLWPPVWVWVVLAIAGAVIAFVRGADVFHDHAIANVITLIATFIALMTALVWFSFFSGHSRRVRMTPLVSVLAVVAILAALYRIDHVSGELVPTWSPRFSFRMYWAKGDLLPTITVCFCAKPDELLQKLEPVHQEATADLLVATAHDFPQFLGSGRKLSVENVELARDWERQPPKLVWRQEIGAGWSAFAVVGGYAVTMEQRGELEMVSCYDVETGRLRWAHGVEARFQTKLAGVGPRATPTFDEGMVYSLGAKGRLPCLDGATGRLQWEKDLREEFGVSEDDDEMQLPYGRSNSPLIVGDLVVVPAGGPVGGPWVSLVAYDKRTGDPVWQGGNRQVSYSSPVLATLGGVEQILIVSQDYVGGHDPKTGKVLWEHDLPGNSATDANVSQPIPLPAGRVFLSKAYGHGAELLKLTPGDDGTFETERLWHNPRVMRTKFTNVAIRDGYVYGLSDGILECIELERGRRKWKGGRYGHGQILLVGDLLLVSSESGEVFLVEATPERRNSVLGSFQAVEGMTWNNLAMYGNYLLIRNAEEAACYDVRLDLPAR